MESLTALTAADAIVVAETAYTHARDKLAAVGEAMPPWDELTYERQNAMASDVLDIYDALASNGIVLMKVEG